MRTEGDNMNGLKRQNRAAVLMNLHRYGGLSRKRLAAMLRLTPAAMTKIVAELISEGLVYEEGSMPSGGAGRREITLRLKTDSFCTLGVSIGLKKASVSAVRIDGAVIASETVPLPNQAPAEETVKMLSERLLTLARENGVDRENVLGLGIAVRGVIAADGRTVKTTFDALDTTDFPLCDRFETYTGLPSVLSNNVRALLAAQTFLSREEQPESIFFLRCGSGIGAAFSAGGEILEGDKRQCAEIGHIPVIKRGGKPCHCGKSGCLETIASPAAIREDAEACLSETETPLLWKLTNGKKDAVTTARVLDAARGGDAGAARICDRAAEALADALKSVVYLLDPGKLVLYGGIFEHPYFMSRLSAEMDVGVDAAHAAPMEKSRFNGKLEPCAAGLLYTIHFYKNGGMTE
ncbi:MAG: ROK family transcriptional regulator [Clostridia bacterium]|nr:ROK family transcriptional regulator [Clostridia bacterium]